MEFSEDLLQSSPKIITLSDWSAGPDNILGTYSPLKFSLSLSPKIHNILSSSESGIHEGSRLPWDVVQAFSTALHENIHWWQHIGSTAGFIFSLAGPMQFHANYGHLKNFLKKIGPKMPIINITSSKTMLQQLEKEEQDTCNKIINNYMDIEFFFNYQFSPEKFEEKAGNIYFECLGHSFDITYGNAITTLIATLDMYKEGEDIESLFPNANIMAEINSERKSKKENNYYHGSPIILPPFGLNYIFEGQARFSQIQYLSLSSNKKFDFDHANSAGMMSELYTKAFNFYIEKTG